MVETDVQHDREGADPAALERPVDSQTLYSLLHAGCLGRDTTEAALLAIGVRRDWRRHADLVLLVLGTGLLLSGAIYFFAYNWTRLGNLVRLDAPQVLVVGCALFAWKRGPHTVSGRVLSFATCVLIGVTLAAFGQVYQTGADAYEFFRAWALAIVLIVIGSRDPALWLLLLAITDASIAAYLEAVHFRGLDGVSWGWPVLAATQIVVLAGLEVSSGRRWCPHRARWPRWPRWVLVPSILFLEVAPLSIALLDDRWTPPAASAVVAIAVASFGAGFWYYRRVVPDLFAIACLGFAAAWILVVGSARVLGAFRGGSGSCGVLFLIGLEVVALLTLLVKWLRGIALAGGEPDGDA